MIHPALAVLAVILLALSGNVQAAPTDPRICGASPERTADGSIRRSKAVLRAYQKIHPCPSTGRTTGKCPGWSLDHVIPLACGGCDSIENLQWLKNSIKSCAGTWCKDRWERAINCQPLNLPQ